jgi:uncharacterized protein (DUF305 family)
MLKRFGLLLLVLFAVPLVSADEPIPERAGRAEMRFLEGMMDHHQMALDMANDCLGKAATQAITMLCEAIIEAQSAEIMQMQGWLLDWYNIRYAPVAMVAGEADQGDHGGHGGHGVAAATDPAMTMGMFAGLNRLSGTEYEIAWLEAMIDHHDDAIHMASRALRRAEHAEVINLANAIIRDQSAEIAQMELLIEMSSG